MNEHTIQLLTDLETAIKATRHSLGPEDHAVKVAAVDKARAALITETERVAGLIAKRTDELVQTSQLLESVNRHNAKLIAQMRRIVKGEVHYRPVPDLFCLTATWDRNAVRDFPAAWERIIEDLRDGFERATRGTGVTVGG